MSVKEETSVGRRDFFRKAVGAGAAGAAAVALSATGAKATETPEQGKGYQETEHVKTYYRLARF